MIYKAKDILNFLINGKTKYRLHSPFVFNFVNSVLLDNRKYYAFDIINRIKKATHQHPQKIAIKDLGAGSNGQIKKERSLASIVNKSAIKHKYGKLLFRLVNYYKPENIIELGTCIGIGTMYLATGNLKSKLTTIEGDPSLAKIASNNFQKYPGDLSHIKQVIGNFDDVLPNVLASYSKIDLAFIDGNHRKEPTLNYFHQILEYTDENSILIFDDIHWSKEMMEAWATIQQHPKVSLTIDIYRMGFVFFGNERKEQEHFQLYF
ncbi:MAG: class I SAM-dependent methyltransferase [Chitinophagales bacterium]